MAYGSIRELVDLIFSKDHECVADLFVIEEARRNLASKYPQRLGSFGALLRQLTVVGVSRWDLGISKSLPLPEKDQPVLAAAIGLDCDVLLTGDRTHFGPLYGRTFQGVAVHSPRTLAEKLLT
jgi:hypothetical protein